MFHSFRRTTGVLQTDRHRRSEMENYIALSMIAHIRFSIWRSSAILNLQNFDFSLNVHPGKWDMHLRTKFGRNGIIRCWDMEIKLFWKWRPSAKMAVLVTWPISACDSSSPFQNSRWSVNRPMAPRYSQKWFFNIASVRHLGFVMQSSYCIVKLYFMFPTLC